MINNLWSLYLYGSIYRLVSFLSILINLKYYFDFNILTFFRHNQSVLIFKLFVKNFWYQWIKIYNLNEGSQ